MDMWENKQGDCEQNAVLDYKKKFIRLGLVELCDKTKPLNFQIHLFKLLKDKLLLVDIYKVVRLLVSLQLLLYRLPKIYKVNISDQSC